MATAPAARVLLDDRVQQPSRRWRVWLMDGRGVPGAVGATCLVFDAGDIVRRIWNPPAHWSAPSDDALLALMHAG